MLPPTESSSEPAKPTPDGRGQEKASGPPWGVPSLTVPEPLELSTEDGVACPGPAQELGTEPMSGEARSAGSKRTLSLSVPCGGW